MGDETKQAGPDGRSDEPVEGLDVVSHELRETDGDATGAGPEQGRKGPGAADGGDDVEGHRAYRHSDASLKQRIRPI